MRIQRRIPTSSNGKHVPRCTEGCNKYYKQSVGNIERKTNRNKKGKQNRNRKQNSKTNSEKRSTGFALAEKYENQCVTAEKQINGTFGCVP